jgi:ankyrin repeat protein
MTEMSKIKLHYTTQPFIVSSKNTNFTAREPMLMMLVKQGAMIDAKDSNGMTPLHHAAMKKDPQTLQQNAKIIERLVTFGANIDSQMKDGSTPLHLACQSDSFANAKVLVSLPLTHQPM